MAEASINEIMEIDRRVLEHIGRIVRNASEIEVELTTLICFLVDRDDTSKEFPLVSGRRLSDLIRMVDEVMPDFTDRRAFLKALKRVNKYRDRLAHAGRDARVDNFSSANTQQMLRQRRTVRDSIRLDLSGMELAEQEHTAVYEVVQMLNGSYLLRYEAQSSIRETLAKMKIVSGGAREPFLVGADRWVFKRGESA
jgi:hypothetical protein